MDTVQTTINEIIQECINQGITLKTQQAYILATVEWETAKTFRPVEEAFWKDEDWRKANLRYFPYHGRGYVQLTWLRNYQYYGDLLKIDLVGDPDLAMDPTTSRFILVHGFKNGVFTGKKISDFINENQTDFVNARKCINGLDKANTIEELAKGYLNKI